MNDEQGHLSATDSEQLDIKDAWQVLWWCRMMNITKTQLEEAIQSVGTDPTEVRRFLSENRPETKQP